MGVQRLTVYTLYGNVHKVVGVRACGFLPFRYRQPSGQESRRPPDERVLDGC
jgi:hypothetical protein